MNRSYKDDGESFHSSFPDLNPHSVSFSSHSGFILTFTSFFFNFLMAGNPPPDPNQPLFGNHRSQVPQSGWHGMDDQIPDGHSYNQWNIAGTQMGNEACSIIMSLCWHLLADSPNQNDQVCNDQTHHYNKKLPPSVSSTHHQVFHVQIFNFSSAGQPLCHSC